MRTYVLDACVCCGCVAHPAPSIWQFTFGLSWCIRNGTFLFAHTYSHMDMVLYGKDALLKGYKASGQFWWCYCCCLCVQGVPSRGANIIDSWKKVNFFFEDIKMKLRYAKAAVADGQPSALTNVSIIFVCVGWSVMCRAADKGNCSQALSVPTRQALFTHAIL